ncbi:tripartite tricarboxylate transporter substrate-binding protein [Variovorax ureilyticus]|uniref:Tripartite tricarboxylate transporter substrate-binding protein n=1 Tax=Variovorax ureilyticus TaxID=1836198 RepID=A0ABU8VP95_9BURK
MRRELLLSLGLLLVGLSGAVSAWPTKPIKIIVPAAAGTPPDNVARFLGQSLERKLGKPVVIDNRPGASTNIGMQACAAADADGHTFCFTLSDSVTLNPHLFRKLPYDTEKSFSPVAILAWANTAVVVSSSVPARTVAEVVALSKANPASLNWASFGIGSNSHLYLEWIRSKTGWEVTHVPYRGNPLQPVLAGESQITLMPIGTLQQYIESGKLVALAVTGTQRSPFLPNVPTFVELGLGDFFVRTWLGLFAPAGTPQSVVDTMATETIAIVNDPAFKTRVMDPLTFSPGIEGPREMQVQVARDREKGAALVKIANVTMD